MNSVTTSEIDDIVIFDGHDLAREIVQLCRIFEQFEFRAVFRERVGNTGL